MTPTDYGLAFAVAVLAAFLLVPKIRRWAEQHQTKSAHEALLERMDKILAEPRCCAAVPILENANAEDQKRWDMAFDQGTKQFAALVKLGSEQTALLEKLTANGHTPVPDYSQAILALAKIGTEQTEQLLKMNGQIAEFIAGQRRVMRAIDGSAGTEDDEVWEAARVIKERYPELTLEDAVLRARNQRVYSGGR